MATERIDIVVSETGSRVVKRNLEDVGTSAKKSADGVDLLKKVLASLATVAVVAKVIEYADAYTTLQNRLKAAGTEGLALSAVYEKLRTAADDTRSSLHSTVELYSRLAISAKELGVSQNELIGFTRSLNQAVILSGASGQEAAAGIIQLSQGLASGTLRGDELRSVLEQLPAVADVIAKQLHVTRGQLRQMGTDGKITSQVVIEAFKNARAELEQRFAKTVPTVAQAFEVLKNNVVDLVGKFDTQIGASRSLAGALIYVSKNLDTIAVSAAKAGGALLTLVTTMAVFRVGIALSTLGASGLFTVIQAGATAAITRVGVLFALISAHPIVALITAIVAATGLLATFGTDIKVGIDNITTLTDVAKAFGEAGADAFRSVSEVVKETFRGVADIAGLAFDDIKALLGSGVSDYLSTFASFFDGVGSGFAGVLRGAARVVDAISGLLTGLGLAVIRTFNGLPGAVSEIFKRVYNEGIQIVEDLLNAVIGAINKVRSFVGASLIDTVSITKLEVDKQFFEKYGEDIAGSIQEGFNIQGGFAEKFVQDTFKRAQDLAGIREEQKRLLLRAQTGLGGLGTLDDKTKAAKTPVDPHELEKAKNAFRSLLDKIAPVQGALLEVAKAEDTLKTARKFGLVSAEGEIKYLELLDLHYKDAIDPLGALTREYDKQVYLLNLTADAREVEGEKMDTVTKLRKQGVIVTQEETLSIGARILKLQELNKVVAIQDQYLAETVVKRAQFARQLEAILGLLADPSSGFKKSDVATALPELFAGTKEAYANQITSVKEFYAQLEALRAADLISEESVQLQKKQMLETLVPPDLFAGTQEQLDLRAAQFQNMYAQVDALRQADLISESTASQMKYKIWADENAQRLQNFSTLFGNLATLQQSSNKKLAAIGKAAAVTQATIDGYLAVQKALGAYPPPLNFVMAAAVGVVAAANVAKIAGFEQGGYTGDGGRSDVAGVVHGREFVVNADATAKNRSQLERMNRGEAGGGIHVSVQNLGTPQKYEVQQMSPNEVRLIARDVVEKETPGLVSRELNNPNSTTSKAMANNLEVARKRY